MKARSVSKRKSWRVAWALLVAMSLTSCASVQQSAKENPKAVLGTIVGVAAGVAIVAASGGNPESMAMAGALGGLLGGFVGKKLDDRDKRMAREAASKAFETARTGESTQWSNPDSGNSGTVTPTKTYQLANGQYCRQYTQDITVGGDKHQTHGTACRQADGGWKVQS